MWYSIFGYLKNIELKMCHQISKKMNVMCKKYITINGGFSTDYRYGVEDDEDDELSGYDS